MDDLDIQAPIRIFDKGATPTPNDSGRRDDDCSSQTIQLFDNGVYIPDIDGNQPLGAECAHFIDCLENNSKPRSDGESGLRVVRILEATMDSLRQDGALTPVFA